MHPISRQFTHRHILSTLILGSFLVPCLGLAMNDAHVQQASGILNEMMVTAQWPSTDGQADQIDALKDQLSAIPKPPRGDRAKARKLNDAGLERFREKDYTQAVSYFQQAHAADSGDIEAAANLGMACVRSGDTECALKSLGHAVTLAPNRTATWVPLAETFAQAGRGDLAAASYALAYRFSVNREKTLQFLNGIIEGDDPNLALAARTALDLPLVASTKDQVTAGSTSAASSAAQSGFGSLLAAPPAAQPSLPRYNPPATPSPPLASAPPAEEQPGIRLIQTPTPAPPPSQAHTTAPSASTDDQVEVISQGIGIDADAALRNAYSNAIQQALGLYVDAETLIENDQIIKDQVLTHSRGLIKEVTTVSEGASDGLFNVTIRARVLRQPLMEKVSPMLKATAKIDGTSMHAAIVTEQRQTQDAGALFAEAIKPMIGPGLFDFEFAGKPELDEKDQSRLLVPVKLKINRDRYKVAEQALLDVLNQVSVQKADISYVGAFTSPYDAIHHSGFQTLSKTLNDQRQKPFSIVFIQTWVSPNRQSSKITGFLAPVDADAREIKGALEVNLFDSDGELLALGSKPLSELESQKLSPYNIRVSAAHNESSMYMFISHYVYVNYDGFFPEAVTIVPISVDPTIIGAMESASIEVKWEQ